MQFLDFDDACIVSSFVAYPLDSCSSIPSSCGVVITTGENGRKRQRTYGNDIVGNGVSSRFDARG